MSIRALAAAAVLAAWTANPSSAAPLQPTGKWIADFAENKCLLSRSYGTSAKPLDLSFEQAPMSDEIEIHLFKTGSRDDFRNGRGKVTFGTSAPIEVPFGAFLTQSNFRRLDIWIPEDSYPAAKSADTLSISVSGEADESFALPGFAAALSVLHDCVVDLGEHWGVSAEEQSRVRTPAKAVRPLNNYFSDQDYPYVALRQEATGRTNVRLAVDETGRVTDCVLMRSSGNASLDHTTCGVLIRKAQFHPALDLNGQPVKSIILTNVNWLIMGS